VILTLFNISNNFKLRFTFQVLMFAILIWL